MTSSTSAASLLAAVNALMAPASTPSPALAPTAATAPATIAQPTISAAPEYSLSTRTVPQREDVDDNDDNSEEEDEDELPEPVDSSKQQANLDLAALQQLQQQLTKAGSLSPSTSLALDQVRLQMTQKLAAAALAAATEVKATVTASASKGTVKAGAPATKAGTATTAATAIKSAMKRVQIQVEDKDEGEDEKDDVPSGNSSDEDMDDEDEKQRRSSRKSRPARRPISSRKKNAKTKKDKEDEDNDDEEDDSPEDERPRRERLKPATHGMPHVLGNNWFTGVVIALMIFSVWWMIGAQIIVSFSSGLLIMCLLYVILITFLILNHVIFIIPPLRNVKDAWLNKKASDDERMLKFVRAMNSVLVTLFLLVCVVIVVCVALFLGLPELTLSGVVLQHLSAMPPSNTAMFVLLLVFAAFTIIAVVAWFLFLLLFLRDCTRRLEEHHLSVQGANKKLKEVVVVDTISE
jgi:hypothetical protein